MIQQDLPDDPRLADPAEIPMQGLTPTSRMDTSSPGSASMIRGVPTEGRSPLATGQTTSAQVISSEPAREGRGYQVQLQLASGEQLSLRLDRPLNPGQALQVQGRSEGLVDLRLLPATSPQAHIQQQFQSLMAQVPALPSRVAAGQALPLNPGQSLIAQVASSQTQPATPGQPGSETHYRVQVQFAQGQQLTLITDRPLQPGQNLQITRPDTGGQLELRQVTPVAQQLLSHLALLNPATSSSASREPTSLQSLLQAASQQLRLALPRQAPLSQPLQLLSQLARQLPSAPNTPSAATNPAATTRSAPASKPSVPGQTAPPLTSQPSLREHLAGLLQRIPQGQQPPTAQQLQQFIPLSGLLLEANLLRGLSSNLLQGDLKHLLQQASAQLRAQGQASQATQQQVNQQIGQQLQAAQARIQVLQQSSLQATQASFERGQPAQILQLDLPYSVRGEWFQAQLEIRRWIEEKDAEAAAAEAGRKTRSWEVQLSFDLPEWGCLHTLLKLQGEHLKADVWVEESQAYAPMQKEVALLEARLRRLGAEIESVDCHLGQPPLRPSGQRSQPIIDTEI